MKKRGHKPLFYYFIKLPDSGKYNLIINFQTFQIGIILTLPDKRVKMIKIDLLHFSFILITHFSLCAQKQAPWSAKTKNICKN